MLRATNYFAHRLQTPVTQFPKILSARHMSSGKPQNGGNFFDEFFSSPPQKPDRNSHPEVFHLKGSATDQILECQSKIVDHFPYPLRFGDVIGARDKSIRDSSIEQLAFDVFYSPPSPVVRALFKIRIKVGQILGLEKELSELPRDEVWKGPGDPLVPGKRLFFFEIKSVDQENQEVVVGAATRINDVAMSLKKHDDTLYFVSCVHPFNVFGTLYWKSIQPFHKVVIGSWLKNAGDSYLREQLLGKTDSKKEQ